MNYNPKSIEKKWQKNLGRKKDLSIRDWTR